MIRKVLIALCLMAAAQPALAAGRGYLGVWFGNLPSSENAARTGVVVKMVFPGMAGDKAGLKAGQIVTQINGIPVQDPRDGVALLAENSAGERVRLTVIDPSAGKPHQSYVFATMGTKPSGEFEEIMIIPKTPRRTPRLSH